MGCSIKKLSTRDEGEEDEGIEREGFSLGCVRGIGNRVVVVQQRKGK